MLHILWKEHHWCSERSSSSVWWLSNKESAPQEGSSVCTETERVAMAADLVPLCCSTELLGGTGRLSLEPVLLVVACSNFCLCGRLSPEPADFAAVMLTASFLGLTHSWACLGRACWLSWCAVLRLLLRDAHFCSSSRCGLVRSFVPVPVAACTRKYNDVQAAKLHC